MSQTAVRVSPPIPSTPDRILQDAMLKARLSEAGPDARPVELHYRLHGQAGAPLVAVLGGISANRQVQCWWRALYGPGRCLDPDRMLILSLDWLDHGGDLAARVSTHSQARALSIVLDHLELDRIDVLIGASYGAMVGLAFACHHAERVGRLVAISGADRSRPHSTALRHLQREIVRFGLDAGHPARGVALARALALTTYRPDRLFDQRFGGSGPDLTLNGIAGYFQHVGRVFSENFNAERYCRLSESLDRHQVDPGRIRVPVDLVAIDSDQLVPEFQIRKLASALAGSARLHVVRSAYGHDAFLKETESFNRLLGELLLEVHS